MANEFIIKNGFHSKGDSQVTGSLNVSSTLTVNGSAVGAAFPFSGDAQITGSLNVSSSITTFDINMSTWTLGADGGNNYYYFTGPGDLGGTEQNPDIHLTRGQKYRFYNPMDAHPFQIQDTGGSAFSTGVTNNGVQLGFLSFDVPMDGPTHLKYQCTAHAAMVGNIYIADARVASGSFSGSFQGDGSSLTGISSTPFPFTGDAQITGSLTVSGSGNITSSGYMLITSSNTGGSGNAAMTPGLVINQVGSGQNHSGPAIRLVNSTNGEETNIYHHPGGSGADHGNGLNILTDGGINIECGDDLGSSNKFFRLAKGQALFTIDDDSSAPRTDVKIHNGNGGTAYSRLSLGASSEYWYIEADDNNTPFNIGFDNGSSDTDVITFTKHNGSLTGSFAIIGGPLRVTGSLISSGSVVDFTGATAISGSTFSGSFSGDGSNLTNLPASSTFPFTGDAVITGSLLVSGSSEVTGSFSVTSDAGHMFQINNDGTFTLGDGATVASSNATAVGTGANANGNATAYGNAANASGGGANSFGSFSRATGTYSVAIGYDADATTANSIALGSFTNNTAANSILMQTVGASNITNSDPRVFKVHMSNYTVADFQLGSFNTDSILRSNVEMNNPSASAATSSLAVHGSGSTVFNIIGSEGTLFSIEDDLDGTLFTVNDRSGIPMFEVSASGRIVAEEGESIIRSQRPIVTHTSDFSITSSLDYAGKYHIVGGSITCSINTGSLVPTGAEFEFFQTSSAGNFLFITGSPHVDVIVKNDNMNLAGQGSGASLKYIGGSTFHLVGDLT